MNALILTDLTFGDAGKGSLTDYFTRTENAHTVIRSSGGPQAAHNVHTDDGRHHTFAQFGSGSFIPNTRTHLSRFMLIDPVALLAEARHLEKIGVQNILSRLTIDPRAVLITPFHRAANRLRELARGDARHGSCGMGIGETMADKIADPTAALYAADLRSPKILLEKLRHIQNHKRAQMAALGIPPSHIADQEWSLLTDAGTPEEFAAIFIHAAAQIRFTQTAEILAQKGTVIFEGAQGVLLDEWHGFHPFTTWSTTTFANALTLCREANIARTHIKKIGITRAYATRHGPGPFPTEDAVLTKLIPDSHNITNPWQRTFRVGHLDLVLLRYAITAAGGIDELAVTCLDRLAEIPNLKIAAAYENLNEIPFKPAPNRPHQEFLTALLTRACPILTPISHENLLEKIETALGVPITLTSFGKTHLDKQVHTRPQASAISLV